MRPRSAKRDRRGAALVEAAIVLVLFLTLVFGMLDMGLAVFRNHVVCEAARQGARAAIVHGSEAPNNGCTMNSWGPTSTLYQGPTSQSLYSTTSYTSASAAYTVQADSTSDDLANAVRPYLPGLDPSKVTIGIYWPDDTNDLGNRVTVFINYTDQHFIPVIFGSVFGNNTTALSASSTMTIAH